MKQKDKTPGGIPDGALGETLPQADLRPASQVMRLARMGSFFPTRLSFLRSLIRDLNRQKVQVDRPVWDICAQGFGRAVYTLVLGGRPYSLVAISTRLADEDRTDRVIAEAWDSSYALFDGIPGKSDLDRLEENLPKQEKGRFQETELIISRANKSVRFFEHCVSALASGRQPDREKLGATGYLMRTTAVYGNGKFGIADRSVFEARAELNGPFRAEMLTVWLIREFTLDLADHIARSRSGDTAVLLGADHRRALGIGNSTGLGMAPFLVNHPTLLNNWMLVRETALARVRALQTPDPETLLRFHEVLDRAGQHIRQWSVGDERQMGRIELLREELAQFSQTRLPGLLASACPWDRIIEETALFSLELQELMVSLVLEPQGELIDGLAQCMTAPPLPRLDPRWTVADISVVLHRHFQWALDLGIEESREGQQRFWYVSEEKAEPRIGDRYREEGADKELPLDIARQIQSLERVLANLDPGMSVAELAMAQPDLRRLLIRIQIAQTHPYSEIQDNLIAASCLPIDMLRCKLSFFGASRFDPKSDLWTRITLYQGAPGCSEISHPDADNWAFPCLPD